MTTSSKHDIDYASYQSILCLDGTLPDASFFQVGLPIIAADGAANTLMRMGVEPDIVIGDLDSIEPVFRQQLTTHYHFDQNYCDFEKSLQYLEAESLMPCIIVGINGGYLDHILNNINIFMRSNNLLYSPPMIGYVLSCDQSRTLELPLNTKLSMMGIPSASVTTRGLQWELDKSLLTFPGKNSCFNRNVRANIQITVHEGCLLLLIYMQQSARKS
tara:strand:- start:2579 stop:3226 length:648 start_codon:yes stop_codon:yes gene_type:complete